jgi:transglutaminase superfamily protein
LRATLCAADNKGEMLMQRRDILKAACMLPAALGAARAHATQARTPEAPGPASGWRQYEIATEVRLAGSEGPATLWLPVAQSAGDYQKSLGVTWQGDARHAEIVRDPVYGAAILRADWDDRTGRALRLVQRVAVRDRGPQGARASIAEQQLYLRPTPDMPLDGIVEATSDRIVQGHASPDAKLRAIYDWVVENCFRDPKTPGCGMGRIRRMLEARELGGKCADQSSLLVGLARAAGIPEPGRRGRHHEGAALPGRGLSPVAWLDARRSRRCPQGRADREAAAAGSRNRGVPGAGLRQLGDELGRLQFRARLPPARQHGDRRVPDVSGGTDRRRRAGLAAAAAVRVCDLVAPDLT